MTESLSKGSQRFDGIDGDCGGVDDATMRLLALTLVLASALTSAATQPRVLILGDSIAYAGGWPTRVESALRNTSTYTDAVILNLALPSETTSGLSEPGHAGGTFPRPCVHDRLSAVLKQTKPTLVIANYGMNDGIYEPLSDANFSAFKQGMEKLVTVCRASGARVIVITPPLHAADKTKTSPTDYDNVLEAYAGWLNSKTAMGWEVVDIRPALRDAIADEKSRDRSFRYASDNVHPGDTGHRLIADAVLEGIWPLLKLNGKPEAGSAARLKAIGEAQNALKLAWLTQTGHKRPGLPKGVSVAQAEQQAAAALEKARKL